VWVGDIELGAKVRDTREECVCRRQFITPCHDMGIRVHAPSVYSSEDPLANKMGKFTLVTSRRVDRTLNVDVANTHAPCAQRALHDPQRTHLVNVRPVQVSSLCSVGV
jgi:hypothetical protein